MKIRSRAAGALALAALTLLVLAPTAPAQRYGEHPPQNGGGSWAHDLGLDWFDTTNQTVAAAAYPEAVTGSRAWAVSWIAAARAVGGSEDRSYATAAFAQALHDTLVALVPSQASQLDAQLASTLATIPAGPAKDGGIAAGKNQAAAVLADRANDGLDTASVDIPYTPPSTDPGVWQPTPPNFGPATRAGQGDGRPFLLQSGDQFDPGPPPSLDSKTYRRDLAEVRAYGSSDSSVRTPEQTEIAQFWYPGLGVHFNQILRAVLDDTDHSLAWQARFIAAFHAVTTDTQIAVYNAKFKYAFWRPVTAIRNDAVNPDPSWTPLSVTPTYPEWVSGHGGYVAAAQAVLADFVGPRTPAPIALTSPSAPGVVRTYTDWATITREVIDARVWEGVHYRFSDEAGAKLGKRVAGWDLNRLDELGI
ncbi:MAG: vanadium-dependent haloperoxidase [Solirubrobacterales bacterium]